MKVGVSRPDPLPGFPVESRARALARHRQPTRLLRPRRVRRIRRAARPLPLPDDEDEFAAFRNAAAASDATDAAAAASVPERQYSDADLGALCNQAAVKLGDPSPIKEIIASYTPEGQVAHSRNIPADKRAEFVKAVEAKAGIRIRRLTTGENGAGSPIPQPPTPLPILTDNEETTMADEGQTVMNFSDTRKSTF
jgi:hypothetical protein